MRHYYQLSPLVWVSTGIAYVTLVGILIYFIYEGLGIEMYLFILAIILLTSITVLWKPVYYEWQPKGVSPYASLALGASLAILGTSG